MNILPKKRWHVRTKDNVARVRKDEAQAAAEEKSRLERAALAEQEARTRLLRERAATKKSQDEGFTFRSTEESSDPLGAETGAGHVNFFAELEQQERTFGANKDYEKEKRSEKEAEEKKIGLLKYLGEGSTEFTKEKPWYQKAPDRNEKSSTKLDKVESLNATSTSLPSSRSVTRISDRQVVFPSDISPEKRKKGKKERKKKKKSKKRKHSSEDEEESLSSEPEETTTNNSLEKLRAERLRREKEEKLKTEQLLKQIRTGRTEPAPKPAVEPAYEQKYSSQFNPQLARQNRL